MLESRKFLFCRLLLLSACTITQRSFTMALTQALKEKSPKVAVIGAGAAGLAVARIMQRAGLDKVVVLEKDAEIGGVWNYQPGAKDRPMYHGLRTNLPKEVMAYREFLFSRDIPKSFVTHRQVLDYLKSYRNHFNLPVQFGCCVQKLKVCTKEDKEAASCVAYPDGEAPWPKIQLEWTDASQQFRKDTFDAVYIANGHYSLPQVPPIRGIENFRGETFHSIEYDLPEKFKDKRILCIGGRASGADIAREMAEAGASHVYVSDAAKDDGKVETLGDQLSWVPRTTGVREDGSLEFDLDCAIHPRVDVIVFCTGYDYDFPFIDESSNLPLTSANRRVEPLYEQLWHAHYPNVAFVGLPHSVVPFPLFELQAEACLAQMAECTLPARSARIQHAKNAEGGEGKQDGRIADTHYLGNMQWEYERGMAKYAGIYDDAMETFIATNKVRSLWEHLGVPYPCR